MKAVLEKKSRPSPSPTSRVLKPETYKKDIKRVECDSKNAANVFLASTLTERSSRCLVLDGAAYKTTRALCKTGNVGRIDIPNFSEAYATLARLDKRYAAVHAHPVSVHDFVTSIPVFTKYDVIYLDSCGYFTTGRADDLRSTLSLVLRKRLVHQNGTVGITVCNRGSVDQWQQCLDYIKVRGCNVTFKKTYGSMMTLFFKLPTVSDGVFLPVGDNAVKCDVCDKSLPGYSMTFFRKSIDHDMCCVCYNRLFKFNN